MVSVRLSDGGIYTTLWNLLITEKKKLYLAVSGRLRGCTRGTFCTALDLPGEGKPRADPENQSGI